MISLAFLLTLLALIVILMLRNFMVYGFRVRRMREIHQFNLACIVKREYERALDYDAVLGSYDSMLWDVRKWTFRQFYPSSLHFGEAVS